MTHEARGESETTREAWERHYGRQKSRQAYPDENLVRLLSRIKRLVARKDPEIQDILVDWLQLIHQQFCFAIHVIHHQGVSLSLLLLKRPRRVLPCWLSDLSRGLSTLNRLNRSRRTG